MSISGETEAIIIRTFLFTLLGAGTYLVARIRYRWRLRASKIWTTTQATIQVVNVEALPRNAGTQVTLAYSYFVVEYRSGEYTSIFADDDQAYDFARYLKNRVIAIRYDPRDPDRSVADEESLAEAIGEALQADASHNEQRIGDLSFDRATYFDKRRTSANPPSRSQRSPRSVRSRPPSCPAKRGDSSGRPPAEPSPSPR